MEKYYKILGVDELTSKPLLRIAYAYAIDFTKQELIEDAKMIDIHLAYQLLKKYRLRFRKWTRKGLKPEQDQELQQIIQEKRNQIANGQIDTSLSGSKFSLEIKYCIRTMLLGIFSLLLAMVSDMLSDFLMLTMDIRGFFASLIFFFAVFNLFGNWIEFYYSFLLIIVAFGLVMWHLKSFEKNVIKAIKEHLN